MSLFILFLSNLLQNSIVFQWKQQKRRILALNKIYAGKGIKTILIDDPIQCMDDINMISFVELLRREFSDCQIILSTHEEDFSNFIRYKFKKYDLIAQAITLKDA